MNDSEAQTFFTGYMNRQAINISTAYNNSKASYSKNWVDLNINIKTAII